MIVGQVRAATGQTLYITDFVGTTYSDADKPIVAQARALRLRHTVGRRFTVAAMADAVLELAAAGAPT